MKYKEHILLEPVGPSIFGRCMECKCWFAVRRESERRDDLVGKITTYRCIKCNAVTEFAQKLPKNTI